MENPVEALEADSTASKTLSAQELANTEPLICMNSLLRPCCHRGSRMRPRLFVKHCVKVSGRGKSLSRLSRKFYRK